MCVCVYEDNLFGSGNRCEKRAHDEVARDGINSFPPHRELTDDERCAEAARIASPRSRSHEEVTQAYQDLKARFKESPKERASSKKNQASRFRAYCDQVFGSNKGVFEYLA